MVLGVLYVLSLSASLPLGSDVSMCTHFVSLSISPSVSAQTLKITSNPASAIVERNGVPVDSPSHRNFQVVHRTKTPFGERLAHAIIARVSLQGHVAHEVALTEDPMDWIDLHGRNHGRYWLFKNDHFQVDLDTVRSTFTGSVSAATAVQPAELRPELSPEELVRRTKSAVVCLKSLNASGSDRRAPINPGDSGRMAK